MGIETLVHRLGICSVYHGYHYLIYGIELVMEDENYLLCMTKRLYPDIGKRFHTTGAKVECSIRTVVTVCWNEGNRNLLNRIAGYELTRKPTTGEFISILSYYLKLRQPPQA